MKTLTSIITAALLATMWLAASPVYHCVAQAGWTNDPYNGFARVANTAAQEESPTVCALAGGRTFITWHNSVIGIDSTRQYYQVLDYNGNPLLPVNGVKLVDGDWINGVWDNMVLPDGYGGCIVILGDRREGAIDIWGQRVDSLGNRLWGPAGLPIVIWSGYEDVTLKEFVCDSLGNFFVGWVKTEYPYVDWADYIQKFRADGVRLWGPYGAVVYQGVPDLEDHQELVPDMQGGVMEIFNNTASSWPQFYFQHLDPSGQPLSSVNGMPIRNLSGVIMQGTLKDGVSDGAGGGIWVSTNSSSHLQLWKLNGQGRMQWIWTSPASYPIQGTYTLMKHPHDNTIWYSNHEMHGSGESHLIYRFDLNGNPLFGNTGIPYGGYLVPCENGVISSRIKFVIGFGVVAQRVNANGNLLWQNYVYLEPPSGTQQWFDVAGDGADGAIFGIEDLRNMGIGHEKDIEAQRINPDGTLGTKPKISPPPEKVIAALSPDFISYSLEKAGLVKIELYDVLGRRAGVLERDWKEAGNYSLRWKGDGLASGVYWLRMEIAGRVMVRKVAVVR